MVQTARDGDSDRVEHKKRRILKAAAEVFRRQGLHATGMRDIAAEIGMHAGNLYYYFRSKEELLAFCQQDALDGLLELASRTADSDESADEKLRRLIVGHVEQLNEETPGSLAHLEVEALGDEWRKRIQAQRDRYEAMVRRTLSDGVATGDFRPIDCTLSARALLGALNWTVKWFHRDGKRTASDIGEEFAELFLSGVRRPTAETSPEA